MDSVAGLLDGPRARGAFVLRSRLDPPWSMRIEDEAPLTVVAVVRGEAVVIPEHDPVLRLGCGDVAVLCGPDSYTVADAPASPLLVRIGRDQRCVAADGGALRDLQAIGVRTWGNSPEGRTLLLTGTYQGRGQVSARLLAALPATLALTAEELDTPLVPLLATEAGRDEPGQEAVLDRLVDLLLIAVLRAWFARPDGHAPGWYRAHADPVVGPALRLLHGDPAQPWTVARLASATGVSRSELARRFSDLVGEPPMTFLTGWRLALAADLLLEPGATVGSVAAQVGYGSAFSLSTAFKRVRGLSPAQHRTQAQHSSSAA